MRLDLLNVLEAIPQPDSGTTEETATYPTITSRFKAAVRKVCEELGISGGGTGAGLVNPLVTITLNNTNADSDVGFHDYTLRYDEALGIYKLKEHVDGQFIVIGSADSYTFDAVTYPIDFAFEDSYIYYGIDLRGDIEFNKTVVDLLPEGLNNCTFEKDGDGDYLYIYVSDPSKPASITINISFEGGGK